ncbi:GerAB/ArcD/ProY family transporter [Cohnella caldifontis]|uniref:GerAB/ArcD/ProY family transporter n=1 Tax=Cohnella caldifontis TaxID=3027471 RepID=UPI0023EDFC02|nr:endospore germination permease [Cohnella sp. YIM B05605]
MKPRETVTSSQMAFLAIAFSIGSSIVYIPSPLEQAAGNAAWLSLAASFGFGLLVLSCVLYLNRTHPGQSMVECCRSLLGPAPAAVAAVFLIAMLFFALPAIVAGIGDFQTSIVMKETPDYVFNSFSFLAVVLTVRAGILVMARMFLLLVVVMLLFSFTVILLALPLYRPEYLLPLLPGGMKPLLHGTFIASGFPFGEIALFTMLMPYAANSESAKLNRRLYAAYSATGVTLLLSAVCSTMTFGPAAGEVQFALFRISYEIQIGELFQRMEAIIGIALILGSYMKACLFLFILNRTAVELLRLRDDKALLFPLSFVCLLLSLTMFRNPADFNHQVYVIWPFIVLSTGCTLVFLLSALAWLSRRTRSFPNGRSENAP